MIKNIFVNFTAFYNLANFRPLHTLITGLNEYFTLYVINSSLEYSATLRRYVTYTLQMCMNKLNGESFFRPLHILNDA